MKPKGPAEANQPGRNGDDERTTVGWRGSGSDERGSDSAARMIWLVPEDGTTPPPPERTNGCFYRSDDPTASP